MYQSLISLIRNTPSLDPLRRSNTLALSETMAADDPISAIVKSVQLRGMLMQLATELDSPGEASFRAALREDEERIAIYISDILGSKSVLEEAGTLDPNSGQELIDVIQNTLERGFLLAREQPVRRVIIRLSAIYDRLPSGLSITGVTGCGQRPTFSGGFGDIYQAVYKQKVVALKCLRIHLRGADFRRIRRFYQEALIWQRLRHPFILPLLGIDPETFSPFPSMVSAWMDHGTVLKFLNNNGRGHVNKMLSEIAEGLQYLHSQKIVHGDLRGANILVTSDWSACLSDFGLAQFTDSFTAMESSSTRAGNVRWMAPELIYPDAFKLRFARTTATDVYAFGCVCLEVRNFVETISHLPISPSSTQANPRFQVWWMVPLFRP
ncbi:kinase-like domain-containing protein [Mycena crocata]|nr:kinase-like domain-containing protein [Mycena crocata]